MDSDAVAGLIGFLAVLASPVFLILFCGLFLGGRNERSHLASLDRRERELSSIPVTNLEYPLCDPRGARSTMVLGQVVIATDYFKSLATALRALVGGEMRAARSLMLRARREALVRLLEEARRAGATEVCNVRFGTSDISQMRGKRGTMQVEVFASGTAVVPAAS